MLLMHLDGEGGLGFSLIDINLRGFIRQLIKFVLYVVSLAKCRTLDPEVAVSNPSMIPLFLQRNADQ